MRAFPRIQRLDLPNPGSLAATNQWVTEEENKNTPTSDSPNLWVQPFGSFWGMQLLMSEVAICDRRRCSQTNMSRGSGSGAENHLLKLFVRHALAQLLGHALQVPEGPR